MDLGGCGGLPPPAPQLGDHADGVHRAVGLHNRRAHRAHRRAHGGQGVAVVGHPELHLAVHRLPERVGALPAVPVLLQVRQAQARPLRRAARVQRHLLVRHAVLVRHRRGHLLLGRVRAHVLLPRRLQQRAVEDPHEQRRRPRAAGHLHHAVPLGPARLGGVHCRGGGALRRVLPLEHAADHAQRLLPAARQPHLLPARRLHRRPVHRVHHLRRVHLPRLRRQLHQQRLA
mmetsp:Transcript_5259/g.13373  ORF Transcript_5259/g.13373 Transcript_5259/m.13373 type:complete len:230 (+) Transcript_5259:229-918(+)